MARMGERREHCAQPGPEPVAPTTGETGDDSEIAEDMRTTNDTNRTNGKGINGKFPLTQARGFETSGPRRAARWGVDRQPFAIDTHV
jgi:hypothetical protein